MIETNLSKNSEDRHDQQHRTVGRRVLLTVLGTAIPVGILVDLFRPLVLERATLEKLATARGLSDPFLDTVDYIVAAAFAGLALCMAVLPFTRFAKLSGKLIVVIWSLTISVILCELSVRLLSRPYVFAPRLKKTFYPDPEIMPGIVGPSLFSTNRRGMRGPEWKNDAYKILCVGGSTVICTYLDNKETWTWLLMDGLNERQNGREYWVGNVGQSGHDTYHHIELLRRLPEASFVDCVIVLCGVNDFNHSIRLPHRLRQRLAPSRVFSRGGPFTPLGPYFKQTYLYRLVKELLKHTPASQAMEIEDVGGKGYVLRRAKRQEARKDYPLPPLDRHLFIYQENLARILVWCRARGIRCIFLTQPTLWHRRMNAELEALCWKAPIGNTGRAVSTADLAVGMEAFNRAMLDFCHAEGAECIDLATACPKDKSVFFDDEHFNESGSRIVANTIVDWLLRETDHREE